jgi:hypothetical protein
LWRRIAETLENIEERQQLIEGTLESIEEALLQKPDRDEVETCGGCTAYELRNELSNVASILAGEEDLDLGLSDLRHRLEELHSLIEGEFEDLKFKLKYPDLR